MRSEKQTSARLNAIGARALTTPMRDGKNVKRLIFGGILGQTSLGRKATSSKFKEAGA